MQLISRTSEYALRSVIWMLQEPTRSQTKQQISEGTQTPPEYVSKVLQRLTKAGLVASRRGLGGGFQLAGDPSAVSVLDVINAVDPPEYINSCPLGLDAHAQHLCPLHSGLNDALSLVESAFSKTKLTQLLEGDPTTLSIPLGIKLKSAACDPAACKTAEKKTSAS